MPRRGGGRRRSYGGGGSSFSFWPFSTSTSSSSSKSSKKGPFFWRPSTTSSSLNDPAPSRAPATSPTSDFVQGASLGSGMRFGDRMADAVVGPRVIRLESTVTTPKSSTSTTPTPTPTPTPTVVNNGGGGDACGIHYEAFQDCLNNCESEISKCQIYMNMLAECRKSSGGAAVLTEA